MSVIDKIRAKAAADVKHVVLAEGTEPRTVQAAEKIVKLGLAKITLVGAKAEIEAKAAELGVDLTILSADQDAATQISQIEQCVSEGYDAILFEPVDPDGLADAAKSVDSGPAGTYRSACSCHFTKEHCAPDFLRL